MAVYIIAFSVTYPYQPPSSILDFSLRENGKNITMKNQVRTHNYAHGCLSSIMVAFWSCLIDGAALIGFHSSCSVNVLEAGNCFFFAQGYISKISDYTVC